MTQPNRPIVAEAVAALSAFHVNNRDDAALLLNMWARMDEMDADEAEAVLAHFDEQVDGGDQR